MIRANLLGRLSIEVDDGEVVLPTIKAQLLIAYLLWHRGQWVRRDELRGMLWGEVNEDRASASLRTALYSLRRAFDVAGVPDDFLESRRDAVRLSPSVDCWVDAVVFEEKAWRGLRAGPTDIEDLAGAAALYRGSFLEFADASWCVAERLRLADLHISVRRALVERLTRSGLYPAAVSHARQWLSTDPLDESAHQALMRLYAVMGQPVRVIEQFEECRRSLETELGVSPSRTTVRLLSQLGVPIARKRLASSMSQIEKAPRRRLPPRLSEDPLRNARMQIVYAVGQALDGDLTSAKATAIEALAAYERLGNKAERAKALLTLARAAINLPDRPFAQLTLQAANLALRYYRDNGPPAELLEALAVTADASWWCGHTDSAIALTRAGIQLASAMDDRDAQANLAMIQAIALRNAHRLTESLAVFEQVASVVPSFGDVQNVFRYLLNRGILSMQLGEFSSAESTLGEAIALSRIIGPRSPRIRHLEWVAQCFLMQVQHHRDNRQALRWLTPPPEVSRQGPGSYAYLAALLAPSGGASPAALDAVGQWLRAGWTVLPPCELPPTVIFVVELMIAANMPKAASWAAAGIRRARTHGWTCWQAVFYSRRALALLRWGRPHAAEICRRRAHETVDPSDRVTEAWLMWVDGLLASDRGRRCAAIHDLTQARDAFQQMGDRYDARQVDRDLVTVSHGAIPSPNTES